MEAIGRQCSRDQIPQYLDRHSHLAKGFLSQLCGQCLLAVPSAISPFLCPSRVEQQDIPAVLTDRWSFRHLSISATIRVGLGRLSTNTGTTTALSAPPEYPVVPPDGGIGTVILPKAQPANTAPTIVIRKPLLSESVDPSVVELNLLNIGLLWPPHPRSRNT